MKQTTIVILLLLIATGTPIQGSINDDFQLITTKVLVHSELGEKWGTGFFYHQLAPPRDPAQTGPQWRAVQNVWLVTNRHVALPRSGEREVLPSRLTFYLRRLDGSKLAWYPVEIRQDELKKRLLLHGNTKVDIALIEVSDLLTEASETQTGLLHWRAVDREHFAGLNRIDVEVADDVVVIGYPRGFYDEANLFPIVKAGIIASKWGANFNGEPKFLVDAKLFPGSSGSLVISKPRDFVIDEGQIFSAKSKRYAFLGILSAAPFQISKPVELEDLIVVQKLGYDLVEVWYATLVEEIAQSGKTISAEK